MYWLGSSQDWFILNKKKVDLKKWCFDEEESSLDDDEKFSLYRIADAAKESLNYKNLVQLLSINTKNSIEFYDLCVRLWNFKNFANTNNECQEEQHSNAQELL